MNIAIFGTGTVGHTIGSKLIDLGHNIMMGSRTADNPKALAFTEKHPGQAHAGTYADAAAFGELIFNCTAGLGSLQAFSMPEEQHLKGKVIIDVANPLDFSKGMPPSLAIVNTNSLGEQMQQLLPNSKVVKALNTMWCGIMVNPTLINNGDHHTFICGNDQDAKEQVKDILTSFGWIKNNILDLGDITKARATEMYLPIWLSIYGATNNGAFNIKIVS